MTSTEQLDFSQTPLCEAVIGATLAIRADFPALSVEAQLAALVAEARDYVSHTEDADMQLESCWSCSIASGDFAVPVASTIFLMLSGSTMC